MSVTEVLEHFEEVIREVKEDQKAIIVEDGGVPQVAILSITEYESLHANRSGNWLEHVDNVREKFHFAHDNWNDRRVN